MGSISLKFLAGAVWVAILAFPHVAFGAAAPSVGIYILSSYVVSAVATNGGTCGAQQGDYHLSGWISPPTGGKKHGLITAPKSLKSLWQMVTTKSGNLALRVF